VAVVVLAGFFFRVWLLTRVPSGMLWDEGASGLDASVLAQGHFYLFDTAHSGHEPLVLYAQAASLRLFGWTPFALRLPSAVFGTLALPATYILGRRLFGPVAGVLAALLLGITLWPVILSRLGLTFSALPLFAALSCYWLVRWLQGQRWRDALIAGGLAGLTLYTYTPGRFVPVAMALTWGLAWLLQPKLRARLLRQGLACVATAAVIFAPLGAYFLRHPGGFSERSNELSIFNPEYGGPLVAGWQSLRATFLMFAFAGEQNWDKNIAGQPILNPILAVLFVAGAVLAISQRRRLRGLTPVVWLVVMVIPLVLTARDLPDFGRISGAAPFVFLLPAIPLSAMWRRWPDARWLLCLGLLGLVAWDYREYFVVWQASADRQQVYRPAVLQAGEAAIARLEAPGAPKTVYFGTLEPYDAVTDFLMAGFNIEHPADATRLAGYDARETRVLGQAGTASYLIEAAQPAVTSLDPLSSAVDWRVGSAIDVGGYHLPSSAGPGETLPFRVSWQPLTPPPSDLTFFAHLLDFSQRQVVASIDDNGFPASSWRGGEHVETTFPLAVPAGTAPGAYWLEFGAYLTGGQRLPFAAGQDRQLLGPVIIHGAPAAGAQPQATLSDGLNLLSGRITRQAGNLSVDLQWLPQAPLPANYSVFVHVLDPAGKLVAQADGPPDGGQWPTQYWLPGIPVPDAHTVALPSLPPGLYRTDTGQRLSTSSNGPEADSVLVGRLTI
jgi:4-amino-4-deoxy-L-arabinose transferase-like glycosyltransferase